MQERLWLGSVHMVVLTLLHMVVLTLLLAEQWQVQLKQDEIFKKILPSKAFIKLLVIALF